MKRNSPIEFMCDEEEMSVEKQFDQGASLAEGVSGQMPIDSEYENFCADGYASKGFTPNKNS